ncbi:MAG: hypothetical protein PHP08_03590 [Candidatus Dojkabacteria bacterium]|nr:hypothetical protein [Candidatus Dojkabacteria bacterium]
MSKEKNINSDLSKIAEIISGEMALKKKEEQLKKLKKEAIEEQKNRKREDIIEENVKLEENSSQPKKVVQNIKLFEWEAPDRYEYSFNDKSFIVIIAISLVLILFLAILHKYFLMAALISFLFFLYVVFSTKPMKVKHKITARGIDFNNKLYEWYMFDNFYFTKRKDQNFLIVNTKLRFPTSLIMLLDEQDRLPLFLLLQEYVLYKDIKKQNRLEKISFGEYIPLEKV